MIDYKKRNKITLEILKHDSHTASVIREKRIRLKLIAEHVKKGSILDVGFARTPNPYLKSPVGFDIAKPPKLLDNYKSAKYGNINDGLPFKNQSFDNITAGEFIEHIENPIQFFRECHRVLKAGGRLIITTPNIYCYTEFFRALLGLRFGKSPGEHLYIFAPQILEKVLQICDFEILLKQGANIGLPFISRIFHRLRRIRFKPLYFCERMIFVCKKTRNPEFAVIGNREVLKGILDGGKK